MSTNTVADKQSQALQSKLNAAIASRASLEEDFKTQSSMLIGFINKLSQVSKGINLSLDNRLAQLRNLFAKSAPISEIELKISEILKLLQKNTITNEQNIVQVHNQLNDTCLQLQKTKGLSGDLRKKIRGLLEETKSTKESLMQYIPLLSELLEFYKIALHSNIDIPQNNITNTQKPDVNSELIKQISSCLNKLYLSAQHSQQILAINRKLIHETTNDDVLKRFIEIFDVIVADLQSERDSAQNFLNTLSETLSTVHNTVKQTLSTCKEAQTTNDKINDKLQKQLLEMTGTVKKAMSLDQVKDDINIKLSSIALTLEEKTNLEQRNQQNLANQLTEMATKVEKLEEQSQQFEGKLAEQQHISMHDALTKLSNRAAFDEYFTQSLVRFHHKPFDLALAVIDIDDFKKINDTYGHTAGDKTLQVIANTIQKTVSKDVFVARYGGEEFVLIYSKQNESTLTKELKLINRSIARLPFKFKNNKVSITLSIGATHITKEDNIHTAFERADKAMYKAKFQGKNQVIYS